MNRLAAETSPYLLQHKDNPVDWRPWDAESLAEALRTRRPILLSVGYAACHWCHVMARESFEDPAVAALINRLFIPVKLDREERPDLDALYQRALALLGGQGGWPLTLFLTPEAHPFWGGTYFPPQPRWGRPGFVQILQAVAQAFDDRHPMIESNVRALAQGLAFGSTPKPGDPIDADLLDAAADALLGAIDPDQGGFGGAPKFPNPSALVLLWRAYLRTGRIALRDAVLVTLDRMAMGGIYDHLGGGFARYATDAAWRVPHFEKMLYDNAQLIELFVDAFVATGNPLYRARIEESVDWLLREMRDGEGGFIAALDADSEHEEGKFYVWREAEIDAALGPDAAFFKRHYDVTAAGNWEGKTILNRTASPTLLAAQSEGRLTALRATLLARRAARIRPGADVKILADWNGLAIAALARAGSVLARPDWLDAARGAFAFVCTRLQTPEGRLHHAWCAGRTHPGNLDDYAEMSRAGLTLAQATGDRAFLDCARAWVATLDRDFRAPHADAYPMAPIAATDLVARLCHANDGPVPSGNGRMAEVLASLFHLTGEPVYAGAAERLIRAFAGDAQASPFACAGLLNGADQLLHARLIVALFGASDGSHEVWRHLSLADLVAVPPAPGTPPSPSDPSIGKHRLGARTTFYVCERQTCSPPLTDARALKRPASA